MQILRPLIAAALAFSSATAPAFAQSAAPLSVASVSRASAPTDDSSSLEGGYVIPALAIFAILAAAVVISSNQDDNDLPASP
jgi:hypothetical protein